MSPFPSRVIQQKRDGQTLPREVLESFFRQYLSGEVKDYQMAAFLMAVHFRGMSREELEALLDIMVDSGAVLDLSNLPGPPVDKHSTGGVGDKTSLILAPLAAAAGACVPMISGRGLGHTAGTLDKLEAIPGFRTDLKPAEFRRILEEVGVAMVGQTEEIAPLDRRLYALRDATATVPSIPLIAASIMSKKLAEGIRGLALDVKTGAGAFLPHSRDGLELARLMVELGEARGVRTVALLTGMDAPLGRAVGNGLETREALVCLRGEGPRDLIDLSLALAGEMIWAGGLADTPEEGKALARRALDRGEGVERMARLVEAQGGDPRVVEDPTRIPLTPHHAILEVQEEGVVQKVDPLVLGFGMLELGGGRRHVEDPLDLGVGFSLSVVPGQELEVGAPLGEVHARDADGLERGLGILRAAISVGQEVPGPELPLVRRRISSQGLPPSR